MAESNPRKIEYYVTATGGVPFVKWRDELDLKVRATVAARLSRLELGNEGVSKALGEGIYELKIDIGPGYRVYFGKVGHVIVVILAGGTKRHQNKDIQKAKIYWREWLQNRIS